MTVDEVADAFCHVGRELFHYPLTQQSNASGKRLDSDISCFNNSGDVLNRKVRLGVSAHEHVQRRKAALRPSVNADMGLSQQHHARHALLFPEVVKRVANNGGARRRGCSQERRFDGEQVTKTRGIGASQVREQMISERRCDAHLWPPTP